MLNFRKIYVTFFTLGLFLVSSYGNDKIVSITSDNQWYNLSPYTYAWIDSNNTSSIEQVLCEYCSIVFKQNKKTELHNAHSYKTYWYKITVENKQMIDKNFVLSFENSTIPYLKVYLKRENGLIEYRTTGSSLPFNTRDIVNSNFCFQLSLASAERVTIYAQIIPQGDALNTPVMLYDSMAFTTKSNFVSLMNGVYYGLMLLTLALTFILIISFTSISEKANYIFLGILFFFTLWNADLDGLAFRFLWPSNPFITKFLMYSLPLLGVIFLSLFNDEKTVIENSQLSIAELTREETHQPDTTNASNLVELRERRFFSLMMYYVKMIFSVYIFLFILYTLLYEVDLLYIHAISLILGASLLILTFISWYFQIMQQPRSAKYIISLFISILAWLVVISLKTFTNLLPNEFYTYSFKFFLGVQALILTLAVVSKMRIKLTDKYYDSILKLNQDVIDKSLEINNKRNEISSINKDISIINNLLQKQNKELKVKNEQLINGINYAQNIQQAMLPNISPNARLSKPMFAFYQPKDTLSGDIYFVKQIDDILYVSVIDCTGHGIPGAFLSIVAFNILNTIIVEKKITETDIILQRFQKDISDLFKNNDNNFFSFDAIDIGLITINTTTDFLSYSGSKIPVLIINNEGLTEHKGDSNSVGDLKSNKENAYGMYSQKLEKGDMVYLFTNGFYDQFNRRSERFQKKNLKILLKEIYSHSVNIQKLDLEKRLKEWKETVEQTDDVLIVGIKI